jgi:Glycine zipper
VPVSYFTEQTGIGEMYTFDKATVVHALLVTPVLFKDSIEIVWGGVVGAFVGALVGGRVGALVGGRVGAFVGRLVGAFVDDTTATGVGGTTATGSETGTFVGALVGEEVGAFVVGNTIGVNTHTLVTVLQVSAVVESPSLHSLLL